MHLDEEKVQRLLHDELAPSAATAVREHLEGCGDCRERVAGARKEQDEVFAALRLLDHSPPRIEAHAVIARAGVRPSGRGRWVAGVAALLLAGAAYALTGAPLPGWLEKTLERLGGRSARPPVTSVPERASDRGSAGIAVPPGRALVILFASPQTTGRAEVSLTDDTDVVVDAPIGAATFTSEIDRLVIDNHGSSASFGIRIPRTAPRVEIRVNGDRLFVKDGDRVTAERSDRSGDRYLLPLVPPGH